MSRADTWMPFYVADYLRDTMRLTTEQHGAYLLLILECWNGAGELPGDDASLAAISRLSDAAWRKHRSTLARFFDVTPSTWTHRRVLREHLRAQELSEKRRRAGAKGGRPPKPGGRKEEPIGSDLPAQMEPQTSSQTKTPVQVARPSPLTPPSEDSVVAYAPTDAGAASPQAKAMTALLVETLEGRQGRGSHPGDDHDPDAQAWALAVALLTKRGGLSDRQARSFFAGLLKRHVVRASEMLVPLIHAEDAGTPALQPYLIQSAQNLRTQPRLIHDRGQTPGAAKLEAVFGAMRAARDSPA